MVDVHQQSHAKEEDRAELGEKTNDSGCGGAIEVKRI